MNVGEAEDEVENEGFSGTDWIYSGSNKDDNEDDVRMNHVVKGETMQKK